MAHSTYACNIERRDAGTSLEGGDTLTGSMIKKYPRWAVVTASLLCACGGGDGGSESEDQGLSPMVDAKATGWSRIVSIPPQGGIGLGNAMALTDATLVDGSYHLLTEENRGSQGGNLRDRFSIAFDADSSAKLTVAKVELGEAGDSQLTGGKTADYRYYFKPGTAEAYQSYRETTASGGSAETWSGLRTGASVKVGEIRSSGGGAFAGLADLYADGTALIPGTELNSAYFRDGVWTRIYGRYSEISEPTTVSGYPVQLADGSFYWALVQTGAVAIGARAPRPTLASDEQVKTLVTLAQPASFIADTCYARAFGNQLVFLNAHVDNGATTVSAYRWTEGATSIETLYSEVVLAAEFPLPSVLANQPHQLLIDSNGALTFFAERADNTVGTALVRVDASGAHVVGARIPPGPYLVCGPWLIDGELYAGIGAYAGRAVTQLDFVHKTD